MPRSSGNPQSGRRDCTRRTRLASSMSPRRSTTATSSGVSVGRAAAARLPGRSGRAESRASRARRASIVSRYRSANPYRTGASRSGARGGGASASASGRSSLSSACTRLNRALEHVVAMRGLDALAETHERRRRALGELTGGMPGGGHRQLVERTGPRRRGPWPPPRSFPFADRARPRATAGRSPPPRSRRGAAAGRSSAG